MGTKKLAQVRVTFQPKLQDLVLAMALDARDTDIDVAAEIDHVNRMTRAEAWESLREAYYAYGWVAWPKDFNSATYHAALTRVEGWFNA